MISYETIDWCFVITGVLCVLYICYTSNICKSLATIMVLYDGQMKTLRIAGYLHYFQYILLGHVSTVAGPGAKRSHLWSVECAGKPCSALRVREP